MAGAPPDLLHRQGQLWGNLIYDWAGVRRRRYRWWVQRLRRTFELFDVARIDHFRGFVAPWVAPADAPDAAHTASVRAGGSSTRRPASWPLSLIAEDLGVITPAVARLRDGLGLPGMVVLQFGFDPDDPHGLHRPEHHHRDQVLYTGTHDTTTRCAGGGRRRPPSAARRREALRRAGIRERDSVVGADACARLARAAVHAQAQDVLGAGQRGAHELPGVGRRASGRWRLEPGQLTARCRAAAAFDDRGRRR